MTNVGTTLFIGVGSLYPSPDGVFRSTDGGANWTALNPTANVQNEITALVTAAMEERADALGEILSQAEKRAAQFREMVAKFKSMIDAGKLQVEIRNGLMLVKLPDNIAAGRYQVQLLVKDRQSDKIGNAKAPFEIRGGKK